jgi:uncharacterized protein YdhG (YjbR/CyaY superfamily)
MPFATHDEYLDTLGPDQRYRLEQIIVEVQRRLPNVTRCISYNIPAFKGDRVFFYFAAFKKHVGIYPPIMNNQQLICETDNYRGPKGNLSFPHSEPLPMDLIGRIAEALHQQYS